MVKIDALPGSNDPMHECLRVIAQELSRHSLLPRPLKERSDWLTESLLQKIRQDATDSLQRRGKSYNGKKNAPVSAEIANELQVAGVTQWVSEKTELKLASGFNSVYIIYNEPGESLELHLDSQRFCDINVLVCLDRLDRREPINASTTVFVTGEGVMRLYFDAATSIIFDGCFSIHGRTPIVENEHIILLNLGFRLAHS